MKNKDYNRFKERANKMSRYRNSSSDSSGCACMFYLVFFISMVIMGGMAFDYSLKAFVGMDIPFIFDMVCALFTADTVIGVAIVLWILHAFGLEFPIF